ncbi:hypothetical protein CPB86DRAFT_106139 [Serendipita vermifera]|nr:hypothetical protein CPB86DRAFT_106139 [Serendipita vermifera]
MLRSTASESARLLAIVLMLLSIIYILILQHVPMKPPISDSGAKQLMVIKGSAYFGLVVSVAGSINAVFLLLKMSLRTGEDDNSAEIGVGWRTDLLYSMVCLVLVFLCFLSTVGMLAWYSESIPVWGLVVASLFFASYPVLRAAWELLCP